MFLVHCILRAPQPRSEPYIKALTAVQQDNALRRRSPSLYVTLVRKCIQFVRDTSCLRLPKYYIVFTNSIPCSFPLERVQNHFQSPRVSQHESSSVSRRETNVTF
jgi:hypothetical protein